MQISFEETRLFHDRFPDAGNVVKFARATVSGSRPSFRRGRTIRKTVPQGGCTRLRKRMEPPCFSTMPLVTHRPSPVPTDCLVVKKGENNFLFAESDMPQPLSPTAILTAARPVFKIRVSRHECGEGFRC